MNLRERKKKNGKTFVTRNYARSRQSLSLKNRASPLARLREADQGGEGSVSEWKRDLSDCHGQEVMGNRDTFSRLSIVSPCTRAPVEGMQNAAFSQRDIQAVAECSRPRQRRGLMVAVISYNF